MHYVIGDIHGCYREMMELLKKIEGMDSEAVIYFVGDFIDRGPQVQEVLAWCMEHITPDGRYRSVRGNHEEMALEWYQEWLEWWEEGGFNHPCGIRMPETYYDFSKWMDSMDCLTPEGLEPFMNFFESLPYHLLLRIETVWGKTVDFRLVHSFYEYGDIPEEKQHHSNVWLRMFGGNYVSEEIIVHGHTPTVSLDYICASAKNTVPGRIGYRNNDINVDGGCVFSASFPMYPASLCALRLEDLQEIYVKDVPEQFMERIRLGELEEEQRERLRRFQEMYLAKEPSFRLKILEKMGKPLDISGGET